MRLRPSLLAAVVAASCAGLVGCRAGGYLDPADRGLEDRVDRYVERLRETRTVPGLAVGLVRGGRLVVGKGYGVTRLGGDQKIGSTTVFHTASVSKSLVAWVVMELVGEGALGLEEPIAAHLPYFELADGRTDEVTIGRVLSHLSGLPDVEDYGWEDPAFDEDALERFVRASSGRALEGEPGTFRYSNLGYDVLGDVISKVAGAPFERVMEERLLEPLGMAQSTFLPYEGPLPLAMPHRGALAPRLTAVYPYHRAHAPSSTLESNLQDLCRWIAVNLGRGSFGGRRLLDARLVEDMWRPRAEVAPGVEIGMGWFVREHRGNRMVFHPGRDPGFNALVGFLPDRDVGVIVLSNYDGQSFMEPVEIADGLLDVALGREPRLPAVSLTVPLGRALAAGGAEAAIEEYRRLKREGFEGYEHTTSDLITVGHEARSLGHLDDAIRLYQLNAEEHPDYFAADLALAQTYLELGDEAQAAAHYRRMLSLEPERYGCDRPCYHDDRLARLAGVAD